MSVYCFTEPSYRHGFESFPSAPIESESMHISSETVHIDMPPSKDAANDGHQQGSRDTDAEESPLFINEENDVENVSPVKSKETGNLDKVDQAEDSISSDVAIGRISPGVSNGSDLLSPRDDSSEKENIKSRSKSDDSVSTSTTSPNGQDSGELQVIREQIKLIQQQHSYQLQMIHYLHWQINLISQQQQQSKGGSFPAASNASSVSSDNTFTSFPQIINSNLSNVYSSDPAKIAASVAASIMKGNERLDGNMNKIPPPHDRRAAISPNINPFNHEPFSSLENRKVPINTPLDNSKLSTDNKMVQNNMFLQAIHQQQHRVQQEQLRQQQKTMINHPNALSAGIPPVPELISVFRNNAGARQFPGHDSRANILAGGNLQPGSNGMMGRNEFLSNAVSSAAEAHKLQQRLNESTNEPEFVKNQCRTCRRILSCPSALKLHYRTHTGE